MKPLIVGAAMCFATAAHAQANAATRSLVDSGPRHPVRELTPCIVERIVDGDTIRCRDIGSVRLIGIDAPEGRQSFGDSSVAALKTMIAAGDTISLEPDVAAYDRFRRVLAYAWRDSVQLNWLLVRLGYAVAYRVPPNVQYADFLTAAQRRARDEKRGLWSRDSFRCSPVDYRRGLC